MPNYDYILEDAAIPIASIDTASAFAEFEFEFDNDSYSWLPGQPGEAREIPFKMFNIHKSGIPLLFPFAHTNRKHEEKAIRLNSCFCLIPS